MQFLKSSSPIPVSFISGADALVVPAWVRDVFGVGLSNPSDEGATVVARGEHAALISVHVPGANALHPEAFERATSFAYASIRRELDGLHPARFWNHIPAIHAVMDERRDRYMVFNAARFRAFEGWYGSTDAFSRHVATASGVGHAGSEMMIHCLATRVAGCAVENPRQISSYRYSKRYGPIPPCFARATTVRASENGRSLLLVGGTASIRGEDSVHLDSLELQLEETFENLAALVSTARGSSDGDPLSRYRNLRIYYCHERDVPAILSASRAAFSGRVSLELIQAELCRSELLVEIEGIAEL